MPLAQRRATGGCGDLQILEGELTAGRVDELDAVLSGAKPVHSHRRLAEARDAQQRGTPVGDAAEIVDEPSQGLLHLHESADDHHKLAE